MGGSTDNGAAGTPPIDLNTLTTPDLRGLMVELGLPVSETMTPQEAEAARALAQVLPDQVWAALLNPGMTVRLEGAQGLVENSLEASLSRVQVAPGGERSQVLELSASLAVEAGLRSEALRSAVTPELIERLPEGARETVRGWKAAKPSPLEVSLEASAGERFTYQAVVPPDVGARIAEGDMSAAPNPADPMNMPVGSSVLIRGESFTANSFSARYKLLQFDETVASLEGQGLGIRRVDENIFELTTGPMEAMERDSFLGVGYGNLSVGLTRETRIEGQTISVAQLDLSTPEGQRAYEAFMQTGTVPEAQALGVPRVGARGQVSVDDSAGMALNAGPLSLSTDISAGLQVTETRWADGAAEVETVWNYPSSGTFSRTHNVGADRAVDASSRRWTATFQDVDADTASNLYDVFFDEGGPRVGFPESVTVTMDFTEADLMQLRDRAAELDARKFSQGDDSWRPLASAETPDEIFRQVFAMSNRKDAPDVAHFFLSMQKQSPQDGALTGSLGFLSETSVPVSVSTRGRRSDDVTTLDPNAISGTWVENHRQSDDPPQVTTTLTDLTPPAKAGSLDDLVVPNGTDPVPGFVAPPALALLPEADAAPVLSETPVTAEPLPPVSSAEPLPPVSAAEPLPPVSAAEPLPPVSAAEPLPPVSAAEPLPPVSAAEPLPPVSSAEPLPPVTTVEPLPPVSAAEPLPPVSAVEPLPPVSAAEPLPPVSAAEPPPPVSVPGGGTAGAGEGARPPATATGPAGAPAAPGFDMQDGLLRLNEEGLGVLGLQTALKNQGYDVPTDMRFGPETEQALRDFQARNGLKVDGIAGPETFAALHPRAGSHMADGLIRQPDEGAGVLGTQTALRQLGHDLAADAVFGPDTERAVREFQRDHGLAVDGIVGPKTSAAMVAATRSLGAPERAAEPHAEAPSAEAPDAEPFRSRAGAGAAGSGSSSGAAGAPAGGPAALSHDQQRHLQLAREQLGPTLSARGHSAEQVERICAAAVCAAQEHAERGPVKAFHLSKDGERVAVVQQSAPMSEMSVSAAVQQPAERHLALAQQFAHEQELAAQRRSGAAPAVSERAFA